MPRATCRGQRCSAITACLSISCPAPNLRRVRAAGGRSLTGSRGGLGRWRNTSTWRSTSGAGRSIHSAIAKIGRRRRRRLNHLIPLSQASWTIRSALPHQLRLSRRPLRRRLPVLQPQLHHPLHRLHPAVSVKLHRPHGAGASSARDLRPNRHSISEARSRIFCGELSTKASICCCMSSRY